MEKWNRFVHLPVLPLGEDGRRVTGCADHVRLSREAAAQGMVLLKNEKDTLPLPVGKKVALFGKASADYVKGGGGSGDVTVAWVKNLIDGMEEKQEQGKVSLFAPLNRFYRDYVKNSTLRGFCRARPGSPKCRKNFSGKQGRLRIRRCFPSAGFPGKTGTGRTAIFT